MRNGIAFISPNKLRQSELSTKGSTVNWAKSCFCFCWFFELRASFRPPRPSAFGCHPTHNAPEPLWPFLQVESPREGAPTLPIWAVHGWTLWAKARPAGASHHALVPGKGPVDQCLVEGNSRPFKWLIIRDILGYILSGPSPGTCLPWVTLPELLGSLGQQQQPLHHNRVAAPGVELI